MKKCNCIIGHIPGYEGNIFVRRDDEKKSIKELKEWDSIDMSKMKRFKCCPLCCKELNP